MNRVIGLPAEVFEIILTFLDLDSVKALRLTDHKLAAKCIGPRLLGCIQQPVLDVSSESLRSLHALACNPAISKRVRSLTFLATSLDSSELESSIKSGKFYVRQTNGHFFSTTTTTYSPGDLANAKFSLNWLREQQEARANESWSEMVELLQLTLKGFGELDSIHLDGAYVIGPMQRISSQNGKWYPLWMRASFVFSLVVTSMVQSGATIKQLDAYRNTSRCCIPSSHITTYASDPNSKQLGMLSQGLQSLKLSISGEVQNPSDDTESDEDILSDDEQVSHRTLSLSEGHVSHDDLRVVQVDGVPGITSLLKSAPTLRELDLSFRNTLETGKLNSYDCIIESIAHETHFSNLEKCAFSGFTAKEESLLVFLQKHPSLRSFTLHQCTLTIGSWTPIFCHLERSTPRLESLSLSNLYGKHIQNPQYALRDAHPDSHHREQEEEEDEQEFEGLMNLQPIWDTSQPPRGTSFSTARGESVHTRNFTREELTRGLVFRPLRRGRGAPLGSPELMHWMNSRRALYGPP